mgnify:CR=1 FL=1
MNPLVERRARITVEVERPNAQGQAQALTYEFIEHRMSIQVTQGGNQFGNAKVSIFGVPLASMNQIARLWLETMTPSATDKMRIDVWDGSNFVPFFSGVITWSAVNASGMPAVALEIEANDSAVGMIQPASPYAQEGPVLMKDALTAILGPIGLVVELAPSVPTYQLTRIRTTGTPIEQAAQLMSQFPDLTWYINLQRFLVRPVNGPLGGDPIPVNKGTGMIGYPVYSTSGITVGKLFDPQLRPGVALDVQTEFDFVNRTLWVAAVLQHNLQPNTPGGQWITNIAAQSYGTKGDTAGAQA